MIALALLAIVAGVGLFTYAINRAAAEADRAMESWRYERRDPTPGPEPAWDWDFDEDLQPQKDGNNGTENRPS